MNNDFFYKLFFQSLFLWHTRSDDHELTGSYKVRGVINSETEKRVIFMPAFLFNWVLASVVASNCMQLTNLNDMFTI